MPADIVSEDAVSVSGLGGGRLYTYDFAIDGGGTGTIPLHGPALAANQYVAAAIYQILTPFTSLGSATVALTTGEAANDIVTAAAFGAGGYSAGMHTATPAKLITAARVPAIVIAAAAVTAGKLKVYLDVKSGWG